MAETQECINSREYAEWLAWHSIDPFTIDRTEIMLAQVCAVIMNVNRAKPTSRIYKISDFLLFDKEEKHQDTAQEIEIKLRAMFHGYNQ